MGLESCTCWGFKRNIRFFIMFGFGYGVTCRCLLAISDLWFASSQCLTNKMNGVEKENPSTISLYWCSSREKYCAQSCLKLRVFDFHNSMYLICINVEIYKSWRNCQSVLLHKSKIFRKIVFLKKGKMNVFSPSKVSAKHDFQN